MFIVTFFRFFFLFSLHEIDYEQQINTPICTFLITMPKHIKYIQQSIKKA